MALNESQLRITPSVLDRLVDEDPRESREAPKSRAASMSELRRSVRRDLEWLLNTRCVIDPDKIDLEEVKRSLAMYGLPDFTGIHIKNRLEHKNLVGSLENAIRIFEPRFLDVKITVEPLNELDRQLKFRIEARLDVDPAPEPIVFDSVLQAGGVGFSVVEK